jgi:regulator of protease activity HflC (stomatin/prohibitin superfamily)
VLKGFLDILFLVAGAAFAYYVYYTGRTVAHAVAGGILGLLFIIVSWLGVASFGIIPAGDVGVTLLWGRPTGELKQNGGYFALAPFGYSVYEMQSSAIRQWPVKDATAATKDLQEVTTDIMLNFHLSQDKATQINVYTNLRDNFDNVIGPLTLEALKAVTAHYTAENLIVERSRAKEELDGLLNDRLSKYGIQVDNVSLTQFRFSDTFNQAVEAKVTQEQSALQAQQKLKQVQFEADQTRTIADAAAYALRVKRVNLTALLVQEDWIKQWDGKLPMVTGGNPFIGMPAGLFPSR